MAEPASSMQLGFDYLRTEAIDAHLAGDGMRVLHLCTTALEGLRQAQASGQTLKLEKVRWAFFLALYWYLDEWLGYSITKGLEHVEVEGLSAHDKTLIDYINESLHIPVNIESTESLMACSNDWIKVRSADLEDVAVLLFTIELTWYKNPGGDEWRALADQWRAVLPADSLLLRELVALKERLSAQVSLCSGLEFLSDVSELPESIAWEQRQLVNCWRLFYRAEPEQLDETLRDVASSISVDSPVYSAYWSVIHYSRILRNSKESQFASLARHNVPQSRQPALATQRNRIHQFNTSYSKIARKGFPDNVASERFTCFRMAMLNQIHALRAWDIGGWLGGEQEKAHISLELAARGEVAFVKPAVLTAVRASVRDKKGDYPHLDRALQLLDALPDAERRDLTLQLVSSARFLWDAAHRVISELTDAIPADTLHKVVAWAVELDASAFHLRWRRTYLDPWEQILSHSNNKQDLVEGLKPAMIARATDPFCWEKLHGLLILSILHATDSTATELLDAIIQVDSDDLNWNPYRFSILYNIAQRRPEFREQCIAWLEGFATARNDEYDLFLLRRIDVANDVPTNDAQFRSWLSTSLRQTCDTCLAQKTGQIGVGYRKYHGMIRLVTWPRSNPELIGTLIEVINADYVPFPNKVDPLASLAFLARFGPKSQGKLIAGAAMDWLENGIQGSDLSATGPLSTGQVIGMDATAIIGAFLLLLDSLAERYPSHVGKRLGSWMMTDGVRQPAENAGTVIRIALSLSIASSKHDESQAMALATIADTVAHSAIGAHAPRVIGGLRSILFPREKNQEMEEWRQTPAGRLCFELLQLRLLEVSQHANPSAREEVALIIRDWDRSDVELPQVLIDLKGRLSGDCRSRVRMALSPEVA